MNRLKATPRCITPIAALVIALSIGGIGIAQAGPSPSAHAAKKKGKKKRHALSADYKSGFVDVTDEIDPVTIESMADEAKLIGQPFGSKKAHLTETWLFTYNQYQAPRTDYSGSYQNFFKALVYGKAKGSFHGTYDYSVDANGDPSGPITGVIDGGGGKFKGATGRFTVVNLVAVTHDPVTYRAHWQGWIRY